MRVLIASDDLTFNPALVEAYRARGHVVTTGMANFRLKLGEFDLVHLHWPEELLGWQDCGHRGRTARAIKLLDWWAQRTSLVATVHNLVPHSTESLDGREVGYFSAFYQRMRVIGHFSEYSRERYAAVYPDVPAESQLVHGMNDFSHLRPLARGREAARLTLGLPVDVPVFAVIGAMRKASEAKLLRAAWRRFASADARLVFASNPSSNGLSLPRKLLDRIEHRRWLRDWRIHAIGGNLDDPDLVDVIEAADGIIIPRLGNHLNSGLLPLAMTFDTAVIAPDYGAFREVLTGTPNELYEPGNAKALGEALKAHVRKDREQARLAIRQATGDWGWDEILMKTAPRIEGF